MNLEDRIRDVIGDRDITQAALAQRLDIPYTTLNGYLNRHNRVPLDVIHDIAAELDISTDYLFEFTKDPERPPALSRTERRLVEGFRLLPRQQRELILHMMTFMQEQNRK